MFVQLEIIYKHGLEVVLFQCYDNSLFMIQSETNVIAGMFVLREHSSIS